MAKKDCFDTDLLKKVIPFSPAQRAGIWRHLRENYTDHGVPFEKAVRATGNDLALHPEWVIQALAGKKFALNPRRQLGSLFQREHDRRVTIQQAKDVITEANKNPILAKAERLWNVPRDVGVFGHFGIYGATHLKNSLLIPSEWKNFGDAYTKAWSLARKDWKQLHEYNKFVMESDPEWARLGKLGLDNDLSKAPVGIVSKDMKRAAAAFDYIKKQRTDIAKRWTQGLDDEDAKLVINFINHATGSVMQQAETTRTLGWFLFAPKLLFAQLKEAYVDPVKALGYLAKGKKATAGERVARNYVFTRMGQLAAMQTAILGANYVAGQIAGEDWQPNLTDPTKANWLRIKIAGHSAILSPALEWLKFPIRLIAKGAGSDDTLKDISNDLIRQMIVYRANPALNDVYEGLFGEEPATGRPTPFSGAFKTAKETAHKPQMDYAEWAGQKLPIPVAAGVREFYDSMRSEGLDAPTAMSWTEFALGTGVAGLGFHERTENPYQEPKKPKTPRHQPGWLQDVEDTLSK